MAVKLELSINTIKKPNLPKFAVAESFLGNAHQGIDQDGGLGFAVLDTCGNGINQLGFIHGYRYKSSVGKKGL